MAVQQHEDFGEKIGGAKKDLWRDRGLYVDDLSEMNDREAEKFVKKDNIWKKPDYQAIIDSGVPVDVAYFIKKVRDSIIASPQYLRRDNTPEARLARQKEYIETVRDIQAAVEGVRTVEDAMAAFNKALIGNGYIERMADGISGPRFGVAEKGRDNPVITNKLFSTIRIRSAREFAIDFTQKAKKEQFGVPKEDKVPPGFDIRFYNGGGYSKKDDWELNTYYVTKGYTILKTNIPTREEALKWAQEAAKQRSANGKKRFVPEQLANVRRSGPDYRAGQEITGQHYLDAFGFRGGEFGNWMNQNDRQASLNMGFEALKDLAAALQISEKDIAYQGALAIAFGARGSGGAVAHYEPMRKVINLTKMRGAGSLAHEWWHGLDDYLGEKMGAKGFLSEHPRKYPLMQKLVETMKYKAETPEQAAKRTEAADARIRKNAEGWLDSAVLSSLKRAGDEKTLAEYADLKAAFLAGETGVIDKVSALKKSVTGHVIPKETRTTLQTFEYNLAAMKDREAPSIGRTETDFYRDSKRMGKECEKDGGYWDSEVEMTARAFACYVMDKLRPERSDYLCGHAECAITLVFDKDGSSSVLKAYPQGEERKAINAVFDELVAELKREQILTHADRPLPLRTAAPPAAVREDPVPISSGEQLSLFGGEKPSVLGQLAASKAQGKAAPPKETPKKAHEPER